MAGRKQHSHLTKQGASLDAATIWIVAIGGALTIIVSALTIRKMVLAIVDSRIDQRAEKVVADKLAPVLDELKSVALTLNNGIKDTVDSHTTALRRQDKKLDQLAAGQAQMTGRLDTFIELTTQQR